MNQKRWPWMLGFFLAPVLSSYGVFLLALLIEVGLVRVLGDAAFSYSSDWSAAASVAVWVLLLWAVARVAKRNGAPRSILIAGVLGSLLNAAVAVDSLYNLLKPATPDLLAEPSILDAVRGTALFGVWVYGALAVGIPLAVFLAVRAAPPLKRDVGRADIEQALQPDASRAGH